MLAKNPSYQRSLMLMAQFALAKAHRDYFRDNGMIILEDLVPEKQLQSISEELVRVMKQRGANSPEERFLKGRDVWRESQPIQALVTNRRFAEIAAELSGEKIVRLGFDQYLPKVSRSSFDKFPFYHTFLEDATSLKERISLQGVSGALLICLQGSAQEPTEENPFLPPAGSGVYFGPETPFQLYPLPLDGSYLLIVYCCSTTLYVRHLKDPHEGALKGLGYVFGDRLSDKLHPILYRR